MFDTSEVQQTSLLVASLKYFYVFDGILAIVVDSKLIVEMSYSCEIPLSSNK